MTDKEGKASSSTPTIKDAASSTTATTTTKEGSSTTNVEGPPLVMAGLRLEKLLVDHMTLDYYTNPIKVVRRWLGTSSGATSNPTLTILDIQSAATKLLDPSISCVQNGRTLLLSDTLQSTKSAVTTVAAMETDDPNPTTDPVDTADTTTKTSTTIASAREVECWLFSLMIRQLWKEQQYTMAMQFANDALLITTNHYNNDSSTSNNNTTSADVAASTTPAMKQSMFPLIARLYRFAALAWESYSKQSSSSSSSSSSLNVGSSQDFLTAMSQAHTLAIVRRDVDTQATVLNIMLRELLRHAQVEQAQTLLSNTKFPEETASNNQYCRYLYYSGRIYALRLDYTMAYANLSQCIRKLPQNTGIGFRICVQRLVIVVQLLMGEIPDRSVFNTPECRIELQPYLAITTAVRHGDLVVFEQVVAQHTERLQLDGTYTLISRLAHQVVKAGLRKLHISYSRLSLQDISTRLGLPSAQSAEYVVAKAVRDGVVDATIYHDEGYVESHDLVDVYATKEPAEAFHRRIAYCLTTHNDAVRAMRYPPDAYKKQLEASRGNRRKRNDDKTDEEKAKELEEEFDDEY